MEDRAEKEFRRRAQSYAELSSREVQQREQERFEADRLADRCQKMHRRLFPEEYDLSFLVTVGSDREFREINHRRFSMGVSPLAANGLARDNSSWEYCWRQVQQPPERGGTCADAGLRDGDDDEMAVSGEE